MFVNKPLREKCRNTEFFLVRIFRIWTEYEEILHISPYSVQMQENMDQKKLRIWTLFTLRTFHISREHISESERCFDMKSSRCYFHMKAKILADFQICVSAPSNHFSLDLKY